MSHGGKIAVGLAGGALSASAAGFGDGAGGATRLAQVPSVAGWTVLAIVGFTLLGVWVGRRMRRVELEKSLLPKLPDTPEGRLFYASPVASSISELDTGILLEVNERFCQLSGRDKETLVGRQPASLGLCLDYETLRREFVHRLLRGESVADVEAVFLRPGGEEVHVAVSVQLIEYAGQRAIFSGYFDITTRKRTERALRERELLLSSINANLSGTCVYRMSYAADGAMECSYISPNVEELAGVSVAQMKADPRAIFGLIHPEDLPRFLGEVSKAMADGRDAAVTVRVRHPVKGLRWGQFRSVCAERRADGIQVRDGVVVDVTSDHALAAELIAVRERLELALRASRTCIWENDMKADRITLDATWEEMRGYPPQETTLSWRKLLSLAHHEDRPAIMAEVRRAAKGGADDYCVEQRIATASGGWIWLLSHGRVTARDARGRALRMIGANTDITSRKQAEEEVRQLNANLERLVEQRTAALAASTVQLAKSEQLYRNLVENIRQGYFVTNHRYIFTYCNPAVVAVLGFSENELIGTSVMRVIAPEDQSRVLASYSQWMREGKDDCTIEFRVVVRSGRLIWVEQSTMIIRNEAGKVIECRNTVRDISERKAADAALRQSNERFQAVFERSPISMGLLTLPEGRLVEFNQAGVQAFGYTREEAMGRTSTELNLWACSDERDRYLAELRAKGTVSDFEARMRRKNGEIFIGLYSGSLIEIGGQRFSLNSIQDISARRLAEAALRSSEERLAHALDATRDGLWDWKVGTNEVYFSPQYYRLLGYAPGEFPAELNAFFQLLHPDDVPRVKHASEEHLAGHTAVKQSDVRLRTKTGEYRWFLDRGKVVARDAAGAPTRMVGTITDITERMQNEHEREKIQLRLLQNQKYEALGTLAGGVAHDFNNLLTGMINYTHLAREDCPPDHPQVRESLSEALACADRAKELVQQILLLSRSEDAQRSPVRVGPLVKEALSLLRATLPAAIEIVAEIDPASPLILANPTQIHQVMMNLAINAAHAMKERGGVLTVRVGPHLVSPHAAAELPGLTAGPHVRIEVADTGPGMEPAVMARIFEPFFTTKAVGEGTGLGLALVHSVIRSHGGSIDVQSRPGAGAHFFLYLPAQPDAPPPAAPPASAAQPARGSGQRILLVDDEIMVVTSLQRMLERLGYKVTSCTRPEQALTLFAAAPFDFDLIFSDFQMPGMNGLELIKQCLEVRPGTPAFIASGFAGRVTPVEMRKAGVAQFFQKPIDLGELAAAIARVVSR